MWGLTDASTWITEPGAPSQYDDMGGPLILDKEFGRKCAYYALAEALGGDPASCIAE